MAEKLTIDKNHFLVYQTINELNQCTNEVFLKSSDFKDAVPLLNPDASRYYYMDLNWDDESLSFEGNDGQLHQLKSSEEIGSTPSVLPKTMVYKPSYCKSDSGYTLRNFKLKPDTEMYIKDGDDYISYKGVFSLQENWNYAYERYHKIIYTDSEVVKDSYQFDSTYDFDSATYIKNPTYYEEELKFVNKPAEGPDGIYHTLTCYEYGTYNPIEIYIKNNKTENDYIQLGDNVSLVTFIPYKTPPATSEYSSRNYTLSWILCVFCRGEANSSDWEQVNADHHPRRIKMEWRPIHLANGKSLIYTPEKYKEFFNSYEYKEPDSTDVPSEDLVPASFADVQTVSIEAYNIDYNREADNSGVLYDNREVQDTEEFTRELRLFNTNLPTYLIKQEPVYTISESGLGVKVAENSFILMDCEGYCLYCPELLEKYGIAFIRSDWVYYDENRELCVNVTEQEIKYYYKLLIENGSGYELGDITNGHIYSTKYLPLEKLTPQNGYSNDTSTPGKCSENIIYEFFDKYFNDFTNIERTGVDFNNWFFLVNYRTGANIYPSLMSCGEPAVTTNSRFENHLLSNPLNCDNNFLEIAVYEQANIDSRLVEENKVYSHYVRYRIQKSTNYAQGPKFQEVAFWKMLDGFPTLHTIRGETADRPVNGYLTNHDYNNTIPVWEDNHIITKQIRYFITYNLDVNIMPKEVNKCVPGTWSACLDYKKGTYRKTKVQVKNIIRDYTINQDEYLNEELENRIYVTPSEWYSENEQVIDDEAEAQDWFWLNTISNWCRFEIGTDTTTAELHVWNGMGTWDRFFDIMAYYMQGDNYSLVKKYLYSMDFFIQGPMYSPGILQSCYVPIKNFAGGDGQMRYTTFVLTKDSKSILYKTKANMDYAKAYHHNDYNSYARANYGEPSQAQKDKRDVERDLKRKYVIGSETQPVPCLTRGNNGNLYLHYHFVVQTNGREHGILRNIVNTINEKGIEDISDLNSKCKTIFGDGADKTIDKDWKRYIIKDTTEEFKSDIKDSSDETLFNSASLNNIKSGDKMEPITLIAMRPNPTTSNKTIGDYLERWNK